METQTKSVEEQNKMIAEFMQEGSDGFGLYDYGGEHISLGASKFHNDWNWLMDVIKKMGKIDTPIEYEPLSNVSLYSPIEDVHKEIVEFIEWYNKKQ